MQTFFEPTSPSLPPTCTDDLPTLFTCFQKNDDLQLINATNQAEIESLKNSLEIANEH